MPLAVLLEDAGSDVRASEIVTDIERASRSAARESSASESTKPASVDELLRSALSPSLPPAVVARLLVMFLRALPEPLLSAQTHALLAHAQMDREIARAAQACRALIASSVPAVQRVALAHVVRWLGVRAQRDTGGVLDAVPLMARRYAAVLSTCIVDTARESMAMLRSSRVGGATDSFDQAVACTTFLIEHWKAVCASEWLDCALDRPCTCATSEQKRSASLRPRSQIAASSGGAKTRPGAALTVGAKRVPSPSLFGSLRRMKSAGTDRGGAAGRPMHEFVRSARMCGWLMKKRKRRVNFFQRRYFAAV